MLGHRTQKGFLAFPRLSVRIPQATVKYRRTRPLSRSSVQDDFSKFFLVCQVHLAGEAPVRTGWYVRSTPSPTGVCGKEEELGDLEDKHNIEQDYH